MGEDWKTKVANTMSNLEEGFIVGISAVYQRPVDGVQTHHG